jgi:hypothetical protein
VTEIKVTTNTVRITEVLIEAPIEAMSKGRKTTEGIDRKKFMLPLVTSSPDFQSEIEIPKINAMIVPTKNPVNEIPMVIPSVFQNPTENNNGTKSPRTTQEWGKFRTLAIADASSHKAKLITTIATHLFK